MRLTVVGCTGSFPGPASPASCYLVEAVEAVGAGRTWRIVMDLGSGALGALQRFADPQQLDAVVVSHLHPDHFMDLCGLYVALRYRPEGPGAPLRVYGPEGTLERLIEAYGPDAKEELPRVFDVRPLADGVPFTIGPVEVLPRLVDHPVTAFGLRLEHAGAVMAYTGDTDTCPAMLDLARDADLLLAEASFQEGRDEARGVHLTGRRAGEIASQARAGRLLLTHIPVWTDPDVVHAEAVGSFPGPVEVAVPGSVHVVGAAVPTR